MLISNRANTILLVAILAVGIALVAMFASGARGGPLDPTGAPGSTDGVREPGRPVSSLPFATTGPGYYYLTRNLIGSAGNSGITISHSDVTLDLKGFSLAGVGGSLDGIVAPGNVSNITIRNGTISNWGGSGVLFGLPTFSLGSTIYDLHVSNNGGYGIRVGDRAIVHDVISRDNTLTGIATSRGATIEHCVVSNNGGDGIAAVGNSVVTDCSATNNGGDGISAGQASVVRSNTAFSNGGDGVQVSASSLVEQNTLLLNGQTALDGAGVRATGDANRIVNNVLNVNRYGVAASSSLIIGNFAWNNVDNWGQVSGGDFGPVLSISTIGAAGANPHANFE